MNHGQNRTAANVEPVALARADDIGRSDFPAASVNGFPHPGHGDLHRGNSSAVGIEHANGNDVILAQLLFVQDIPLPAPQISVLAGLNVQS